MQSFVREGMSWMRIQNANRAYAAANGGSAARARSSGSAFALPSDAPSSQGAQGTSLAGMVQDVGSLLTLQSIEDSLQNKRRKAIRKGHKALDLLEDIRMGLLSGSLSLTVLQRLEQLTDDIAAGEPSGDERIDQLLEEINLRAQVEIAKLCMQQEKNAQTR